MVPEERERVCGVIPNPHPETPISLRMYGGARLSLSFGSGRNLELMESGGAETRSFAKDQAGHANSFSICVGHRVWMMDGSIPSYS